MVSTKEEYNDYLKKKSLGIQPEEKWRDEIRGEYSTDSSLPPQFKKNVQPAVNSQESGEVAPEPAPAPKKRVGKFKKKKSK